MAPDARTSKSGLDNFKTSDATLLAICTRWMCMAFTRVLAIGTLKPFTYHLGVYGGGGSDFEIWVGEKETSNGIWPGNGNMCWSSLVAIWPHYPLQHLSYCVVTSFGVIRWATTGPSRDYQSMPYLLLWRIGIRTAPSGDEGDVSYPFLWLPGREQHGVNEPEDTHHT